MSAEETSPAQRAGTLLRRIHSSFDKRGSLPGGAAREKLDEYLADCLGELASLHPAGEPASTEDAPPRPVAVAMALALLGHAHLSIFFHAPGAAATEALPDALPGTPDFPVVLETPALRKALGLQDWEIDDLREEVDRRVGVVLKQQRALDWLWSHFGLPDASPEGLFRALFPGAHRGNGAVGVARRGAQLYVLLDQTPAPPRPSLYLVWGAAEKAHFAPLGAFGGRYVDQSLRAALGRGIGAGEEEVVQILDRMVAVIPRDHAEDFLRHDHWRVRALAGITGVGVSYTEPSWLTRPIGADSVDLGPLFTVEGGLLAVPDAKAAFDGLALPRVSAVLRQIHAELLANQLGELAPEGAFKPRIEELDLYDVAGQVRLALKPLVAWAQAPATASAVAARLGVPLAAAQSGLAELSAAWVAQLDRAWSGAPAAGQPRSVADVITFHLVTFHRALTELRRATPDTRWDHRDLTLLFAAWFVAELPVQSLWAKGLNKAGAPIEEPVSRHFWASWQRVLGTLDRDSETFSGPFTLDY